jgi:heparanase 1
MSAMKQQKDQFRLIRIDEQAATLPAGYLSLTIDTSLVLGGHWWSGGRGLKRGVATDRVVPIDLGNPRLLAFAKLLAPAMLRIGGTESDRVGYRIRKKAKSGIGARRDDEGRIGGDEGRRSGEGVAGEHEFVLKKKLWKRINSFAQGAGFKILFVVSAGPADRDEAGSWISRSARRLIAYSAKKELPVRAWELGNEINGYPFVHGFTSRVSPSQYVEDFSAFSALVREIHPTALAVGPSSSVWPVIGEPNPIIPALARSSAMGPRDILSWHYYPQQSHRGRLANRRASETTLLKPRRLDSVRKLARSVAKSARGREVWMTETGHALYGGEPGLSDTHLSSLWWLDQLGLLAQEGVSRVFRQTLVGSDYGLLDQDTFEPRPDYYASFLWKKLMGRRVFKAPRLEGPDKGIRAYVHSSVKGTSMNCLLLISLRGERSRIAIQGSVVERYVVEPLQGLRSRVLALNGVLVEEDLVFAWGKKRTRLKYRVTRSDAERDDSDSQTETDESTIDVPRYSYAFCLMRR